uniref:MobV family relaxase n=1 Tax=Bilophila wadsworthia TaxID=35833 RepID=UPI00243011AB
MSYLVLHMDKFKKEAIRGIQSHNRRERESHSNPDIDYDRSAANYELHEAASSNYAEAIQNRIDDLLLVKAVRKDAVRMCGLIVTSDKAFFDALTPEETRRFFEESKAFLTEFVGAENVVSAMVHMDEKTPHMHFLHVPVTPDGRLNANKIYTRQSLRKLQAELPAHLQSRDFVIERGVEQTPDSAKRHLDTREFKQQQEAL